MTSYCTFIASLYVMELASAATTSRSRGLQAGRAKSCCVMGNLVSICAMRLPPLAQTGATLKCCLMPWTSWRQQISVANKYIICAEHPVLLAEGEIQLLQWIP